MSVGDYIRGSQVWKSIFRHPAPVDRRNRVVVMLTNFFLHLHPVSIKQQGIALSYTWCMGGITFFLFLVETITGVLLLVLTLLLSFTGYLLPWDQLAIWAITVGSNMARATPFLGNEGPGAQLLNMLMGFEVVHAGSDARFALLAGRLVGEATLLRFYVLHCIFIPLVASV